MNIVKSNNLSLKYQYGLENRSLWQRLNSFASKLGISWTCFIHLKGPTSLLHAYQRLYLRGWRHAAHDKHFACHGWSTTRRINRSRIIPPHDPHLGIVAETKMKNKNKYKNIYFLWFTVFPESWFLWNSFDKWKRGLALLIYHAS